MKGNNMAKANNKLVTDKFLQQRANSAIKQGYPKQRWVYFCERLIQMGFRIFLYEARQTCSKYITVALDGASYRYKVRFSDHKPIQRREMAGDCDFFVGVTNLGTTTTTHALQAVADYFASQPGVCKSQSGIFYFSQEKETS